MRRNINTFHLSENHTVPLGSLTKDKTELCCVFSARDVPASTHTEVILLAQPRLSMCP